MKGISSVHEALKLTCRIITRHLEILCLLGSLVINRF
jgi:hypothetical protein